MKFKQSIFFAFVLFLSTVFVFAQRPGGGGPPREPGQIGQPRMPRGEKPPMRDRDGKQRPDFIEKLDTNKNQKIEFEEFQAAAELSFKALDKNGNGVVDENERRPKPEGFRPESKEIPQFLFFERDVGDLSREAFGERLRQKFNDFDKNSDLVIDRAELERMRPPRGEMREEMRPPLPPTARFLGAEMRFGDKLVGGAPFSAEIKIENTRRLFDGTTVTKTSEGAIYRDTAGRTRREQTLDDIGGFSIGEPQKLIFINDFATNTSYFIDVNRGIVRQNRLRNDKPPRPDFENKEANVESLGTKVLEGVSVEGTRSTFQLARLETINRFRS
jgi:Ca2+-binding EF-hand superfamily protein